MRPVAIDLLIVLFALGVAVILTLPRTVDRVIEARSVLGTDRMIARRRSLRVAVPWLTSAILVLMFGVAWMVVFL
jgi:hypothetical protein